MDFGDSNERVHRPQLADKRLYSSSCISPFPTLRVLEKECPLESNALRGRHTTLSAPGAVGTAAAAAGAAGAAAGGGDGFNSARIAPVKVEEVEVALASPPKWFCLRGTWVLVPPPSSRGAPLEPPAPKTLWNQTIEQENGEGKARAYTAEQG